MRSTALTLKRLLPDALTVDNLHGILVMAADEGVDVADHSAEIDAAFEGASDDVLGTLAVQVRHRIETTTLALRWIQQRGDAAIFNRLVKRRNGDEAAKVAMPHELANFELVPEFSPYVFDVDELEGVLPLLTEAERAKLLRIEPEREDSTLPISEAQRNAIVAAIALISDHAPVVAYHPNVLTTLQGMLETHTLPRRVSAGATASINAIANKYKGSNVETLIRNATKREKVRDKLTINPRGSSEPKPVAAVAQ